MTEKIATHTTREDAAPAEIDLAERRKERREQTPRSVDQATRLDIQRLRSVGAELPTDGGSSIQQWHLSAPTVWTGEYGPSQSGLLCSKSTRLTLESRLSCAMSGHLMPRVLSRHPMPDSLLVALVQLLLERSQPRRALSGWDCPRLRRRRLVRRGGGRRHAIGSALRAGSLVAACCTLPRKGWGIGGGGQRRRDGHGQEGLKRGVAPLAPRYLPADIYTYM